MADDIKKYETAYKKCGSDNKDFTIDNYTKLLKRIKYFRYDTYQGYSQLAEEVAVLKGDKIEGKSIEEFAKESKTVADVLKGIKWNQGKHYDAAKELQDLQKPAADSAASLKKVAADVDKELKILLKDKKTNKDAIKDFEKLQSQIDTDMKELKTFSQKFKLIPDDHLDPYKVFDSEMVKVMNVKPAKSKFHTATDKMFDKAALKKKLMACQKDQKGVSMWATQAEKFAKQGDEESAEKCIVQGKKAMQNILDIEKDYSDIKKKWKAKIDESNDKKEILAAIAFFEKAKETAEKRIADTETEIKKLSK